MSLNESSVKLEADKARLERVEAVKKRQQEATLAVPIVGRTVTPEVTDPDPAKAGLEDKRIGEQDVPLEKRVDGYTAGIRHDQMQGVQSAAWTNDLDEEELLKENLKTPINGAVAEERLSETFVLGVDEAALPASTRAEIEEGKKALERKEAVPVARLEAEKQSGVVDRTQQPLSSSTPTNPPLKQNSLPVSKSK